MTVSRYSLCSIVSSVSSTRSVMPITPLSGSAYLVAHVREEFALGPTGFFGGLLGPSHFFFRAFSHGNVLINPQGAAQFAVDDQPHGVKFNIQKTLIFPLQTSQAMNGRLIQGHSVTFQQGLYIGEQTGDSFSR